MITITTIAQILKLFYILGNGIWNTVMRLVGTTASLTPEEFSSYTWAYVVSDVMSWTLTIGATFLFPFLMIPC